MSEKLELELAVTLRCEAVYRGGGSDNSRYMYIIARLSSAK